MTKKYTQLSIEQRYQIEALRKAGNSQSFIADQLEVHRSTLCRELKRNVPRRGIGARKYAAEKAQIKTNNRHRFKPKQIRFTEEMKDLARGWLEAKKLSPEFIRHVGKKELGDFVSHETIYQWIWDSKQSHRREMQPDKLLYLHLKHGCRKRKRGNRKDGRGVIKNRISIEKRPAIINNRKRIGDKEADLVMGKNHQPGLLILTDRKLRMSWLEKIESKEAGYIENKIKKINRRCKHKILSITFDNDQAFANHDNLKRELKVKTFFTHPYSSQEKGSVENRIGIIRRFFPKKTDFTKVSSDRVKEVEEMINARPMRMFKYASPQDKYKKLVLLRC